MKRRVLVGAVLVAWTWAGAARASANFPPVVESYLMTPPIQMIVGDASGCLLCHVSEAGGLGTNNEFGTLLKNDGAVGGNLGTLIPALDKLAQSNPRAVSDLQMGVNPNDDPTALGNDPIPQYGCTLTRSHGPPRVGGLIAAAALIAAGSLRSRRR